MVGRFDPQAVGDALADVLRPKGLPRKVTVPDVLGKSVGDARSALARAGLRIEVHRDTARPPAVEGRVAFQEPEPGARVRRRSEVRLLLTFPSEPESPPHLVIVAFATATVANATKSAGPAPPTSPGRPPAGA